MGVEHQLKRYIVYTCKKCGWQTAVLSQWADMKPKKCLGKKCGCYFLKEPDQLDIKTPEEEKPKQKAPSSSFKDTKSKRGKRKKKSDERRQEG